MSKEEIEKLALSLKNSGLVASIQDARKRAEEMLGGKNKGKSIKVSEDKDIEEKPKKETKEEAKEEPKEEPKEKQEDKDDDEEGDEPEEEKEPKEEQKTLDEEPEKEELFVNKDAEDSIRGKGLPKEQQDQADLTKLFNFGNK